MKKHLILAALTVLLFIIPLEGQRLPRVGCPQRAHVNELREKTRQKELAFRKKTKSAESTTRYGLIILAAFKNQAFTYDKSYFETLINGSEPTSALSYFNEQWHGTYDFHFDITDIVTVSRDYAYYGEEGKDGDQHPEELIAEACGLVDDKVDFSKYDNDGDGEVDNVFVFYAGDQGEGYDDRVWPHQWYLKDGAGITLKLDNVLINNYACTSELEGQEKAGIGTFCHEYTHTFGIPDLYDFDGASHGYAEAEWSMVDLMDAGNMNNNGNTPPYYSALERWFFEMQPGTILTEGSHTLQPIHKNGDYFIVKTDRQDEVFLIECRSNESWDKYIGGSGMLIYHVDMTASAINKYWKANLLNAYSSHQCMDLIECHPTAASIFRKATDDRSRWNIFDTYVSKVFWPDGGGTAFTSATTPAWTFWSGAACPLSISGITKNSDGSVSFNVSGEGVVLPPSVSIVSSLVLQDACIIRWKADEENYEGGSLLRYKESDASVWTEVNVQSYGNAKFACVLEGLKPRTSYDVVICAVEKDVPGEENKLGSFTTKSVRSGDPPYIYLKGADRTESGAFRAGAEIPLRLYNAPAGSVEWYFNSTKIQPAANGYYTLTSSGTLRAVLHAEGGDLTFTKNIKML